MKMTFQLTHEWHRLCLILWLTNKINKYLLILLCCTFSQRGSMALISRILENIPASRRASLCLFLQNLAPSSCARLQFFARLFPCLVCVHSELGIFKCDVCYVLKIWVQMYVANEASQRPIRENALDTLILVVSALSPLDLWFWPSL